MNQLPTKEELAFLEKSVLNRYITKDVAKFQSTVREINILILDTLAHTNIDCIQYKKYESYLKMVEIFSALIELKKVRELPHYPVQIQDWYKIAHPIREEAKELAERSKREHLDTEPDVEPPWCWFCCC